MTGKRTPRSEFTSGTAIAKSVAALVDPNAGPSQCCSERVCKGALARADVADEKHLRCLTSHLGFSRDGENGLSTVVNEHMAAIALLCECRAVVERLNGDEAVRVKSTSRDIDVEPAALISRASESLVQHIQFEKPRRINLATIGVNVPAQVITRETGHGYAVAKVADIAVTLAVGRRALIGDVEVRASRITHCTSILLKVANPRKACGIQGRTIRANVEPTIGIFRGGQKVVETPRVVEPSVICGLSTVGDVKRPTVVSRRRKARSMELLHRIESRWIKSNSVPHMMRAI
jgi:hypothetical protein